MQLVPVEKDKISLGQPLAFDLFSEDGKLLVRRGTMVENEFQQKSLIKKGFYYLDQSDMDSPQALRSPFRIVEKVVNELMDIYAGIETPDDGLKDKILNISVLIQRACELNSDAALATIPLAAFFLNREVKYTVIHPVHTALVAEIISKELGWAEADRLNLIAAALTMNGTIIGLQDRLYSQIAPPNDEQIKVLKNHPKDGVELLEKNGVKDRTWLEGVLYHHESMDGSGYPYGMMEGIPLPALIVSTGDIYCAKISGRRYRSPMPSSSAAQKLYLECSQKVGAELSQLCIKKMGIYPPGTYVKLKNGEIGLVVKRGEQIFNPLVASLVGSMGGVFKEPRLRDCGDPEFTIEKNISSDTVVYREMDLRDLWNRGF